MCRVELSGGRVSTGPLWFSSPAPATAARLPIEVEPSPRELELSPRPFNAFPVRYDGPRRTYPTGFVYAIQAGDGGPVKIGWTTDLRSRICDLQVANPEKLSVALSFPGTQADEMALQRRCRQHHIRGEWFSCSVLPELLDTG